MLLVTGSSGFIGQAIIKSFKGDAIGLSRTESNDCYVCDLTDIESVKKVAEQLKKHSFSCLVHAAAITPWSKEPNFSLDLKMAESAIWLCNKLKIPQLYFISGWNVYDPEAPLPFSETTPIGPTTEYGISKQRVEEYLVAKSDHTHVLSLRLASVYGPGQTSSGLIPNLVTSALRDSTMTINTLNVKRDYLYIDDLIQAIGNLTSIHNNLPIEYLNIGSGTSVSVIEIAETIQQIFKDAYNQEVRINHTGSQQTQSLNDNRLDITAAQQNKLLLKPTLLLVGLREYIHWRKSENIL